MCRDRSVKLPEALKTQHRTQAEELNTCFIPDEETATAERLQVRVQQEVD